LLRLIIWEGYPSQLFLFIFAMVNSDFDRAEAIVKGLEALVPMGRGKLLEVIKIAAVGMAAISYFTAAEENDCYTPTRRAAWAVLLRNLRAQKLSDLPTDAAVFAAANVNPIPAASVTIETAGGSVSALL
jgi:hypothetical protein